MAQNVPSRAATRWAVRLVPVFIFGAFGYAKYAVVAHLCGTSAAASPQGLSSSPDFFVFFVLRKTNDADQLPYYINS